MKITSIILALVLAAFAFSVNAQSTNNAAQPTNINQAVVSILMGAKDVGGQIFDASKTAVTQSVAFVQSQAPDVIKEFLRWHLFEDLAYIVFFCVIGIIALVIASRLLKSAKKYEKERDIERSAWGFVFGWVFGIAGVITIVSSILANGMDALEIAVAPKIYLIDYITTLIQNHH